MIAERYAPHIYALMRIVFGFLFTFHGLQKTFGMFGGRTAELVSLRGLAGVIEIVAGVMIMAGWFTRPAAFIASGQMAFAYFMSHFRPDAFWPIQNRGEVAVLYCFAFLYIAARGGGRLSVNGR
jgi:putative oxidoreductase